MRDKFLIGGFKNGDLKLLIITMALSILCVSSVWLLASGIRNGLDISGNTLLGGDRALSASMPIGADRVEKAHQLGLKTSETLSFLSMLVHKDALALADIKAVDTFYPLRGVLKSSERLGAEEELLASTPEPGTVWLSADLFPLLNLKIHDIILIGVEPFKVTRVLTLDSVSGSEGLMLAPRVLMNASDVIKTGVLEPGSRQTYTLLVAGTKDKIEQFAQWLVPRLTSIETFHDPKKARPMMHHWLEQGQYYLNLMLLMNWLLASATIFQVARHFSARQFKTVAILRCFGADFKWIMKRFFWEAAFLSVVGGLIGFLMGFLVAFVSRPWFEHALQQPIEWGWMKAISLSFLTVCVLFLMFGLPPLWALRKVTPLHIIRKTVNVSLQEPSKAVAYFRKKYIRFIGRFGVGVRYGMSNCIRRPVQSGIQIMVFALVMLCAWLLFLMKTDLLNTWAHQMPLNTPNYFAINIGPEDVQKFEATLKEARIEYKHLYPIVRGRLLAVNHEQVEMGGVSSPGVRRMNRLLNLTYVLNLPQDNQIISGHWFSKENIGMPIVSVEKEFSERLSIKMNDSLTFQIGEKKIEAKVTSIRKVQWSTFDPNFFMMFPPQVIDSFPKTYMTSFYVSPDKISFLSVLVKQFPSINLLNISMELKQLFSIISTLAWVVEVFWGFMLMMALLLLGCSIIIHKEERQAHVALFRALGASSHRILTIVLSEFCLLGFISGLIAVIFASGLFAWLSRYVFDLPYSLNGSVLVAGPVVGMILVGMFGWLGLREIRFTSPAHLLSAR